MQVKLLSSEVELALVKLIEEKDGKSAAQKLSFINNLQNPGNALIFHRFIQYQIDDAEDGRGKKQFYYT